ncbi:LuxR C-terminal-related transcriptional regulator [Actinomycetospora endophytica]|uniref:LuxR C-terminal-related transcriptional regulator n=1 Tax=Actinomycetospora endophytica TaxID=2291215 RepID=A0ABS8P8Z5_9PSEU|nr:LuxR C-terminal-related transcriptional regulator [Actinomycetospora endophytica]MCD2194745.1 LuxR C-terminal-related transcriptional regulator [Actinomycetospora endophytica]
MRRAKIVVPPRPPQFVDRAGLRAALDDQSEPRERGRVVLVSAPAGHGKTAAVADWVHADPDTPTAWVALDAGDRDEPAWWATLLAALTAALRPDDPLLALVPAWTSGDDPERAAFLAAALDALDSLPRRVRLVLDDVHEIVDHPALAGLRELLRHPLPQLTVVLCCRYDPPIGLDRLRLDDRLGQLRVDELTFTEHDAAHLFAGEGLDLTAEQTATLVARTQGWVAALRLAALSLREADDPAAFVRDFAGDDRSVADYLVGEVLARLGEDEHAVLVAAAVSSPLHVDLAATLADVPDAADVLDRLESRTAMVTATDRHRESYRLHELLRSHVLARLRRNRPAHLGDLYRRAATWHESRGEHVDALRCAALAGDIDTTGVLLRARAVELIGRGEFAALAQSEQMLGHAGGDPRARLVLGLAALESGDPDHAEELIDAAEAELTGHESDNVAVFRRIVATRVAIARGRIGHAVVTARTIRPDAVEGVPLRALALTTRADGLVTTDPEQATRDSAGALALADRHGWPYLAVQARSTLALAGMYGGDRDAITAHARSAVAQAVRHGWPTTAAARRAHVVLASAELLRGSPGAARAHLEQADGPGPTGPHVAAALGTLRGAVEHDTGDRLAGWQRMRHTRIAGSEGDLAAPMLAVAGFLEQCAALGLGRLREASEVTRALDPALDGSVEGAVLRARLLWATGGDPAARKHLTGVFERRHRLLTSLGVVEALLLDAEIAARLDEHARTRERLHRALELAARYELLRPLLALPETLRDHLAAHRGAFGGLDPLVDRVLAHTPSHPDLGALTERERAVLELLPTMRSSTEIADDLAVSVNTVKTHQRAIYHKLGAGSRRDAVARARRGGLLDPS